MATISGTNENDTLQGTDEDDLITGLDGDDSLIGHHGNDTIDGGDGADIISGNSGDDSLLGGSGNDTIQGVGEGNDHIEGGIGDDSLVAEGGNDTILGGDGNDTIYGNAAAGGGTQDADSIDGGAGNDVILGGDFDRNDPGDADTITGGEGNDRIFGFGGADSIDGGAGDDSLEGGKGDDIFVWNGADRGNDEITDFSKDDSGPADDGDPTNNDFVDLSGIFNVSTLAAYNAINGTDFTDPLQAMNHDLAEDETISFNGTDMSGPDLKMTGITGGLTTEQTGVACFVSGTLIQTDRGKIAIEDLCVDDLVQTMDDGLQPLRWIGSTQRGARDLARDSRLRPVRIPAGALGSRLPRRDLLVSRQHRVMIRSRIARRMFGAEEVLLPAIKLVGTCGIKIDEDVTKVTYFHLLFDKHQIVFSEDAPTESLFTGPGAMKSISSEAREELETLFPELLEPAFVAKAARQIPAKGRQLRQLVERHKKNSVPLLRAV